jgi:hypothetical protein
MMSVEKGNDGILADRRLRETKKIWRETNTGKKLACPAVAAIQ